MGKRRAKKQTTKPQISGEELEEEEDHGRFPSSVEVEETGKFFACYLLTSLSPRFKCHTYIGFTVNPRRRIRQHNGEIGSGAFRTKKKRPWEMVMCIHGFPTNVAALQFEWAWQHPVESLAVRKAAAAFKSLSGLGNKIKLAYTMLTLPSWQSLNLTVNFFSTKYKQHIVGCPTLPEHMGVQVCSMDELPCYSGDGLNLYKNNNDWDIQEECDYVESDESLNGHVLEHSLFLDSIRSHGGNSNEDDVLEKSDNNCEEVTTLELDEKSEGILSSPVSKEACNHFCLDDSPVRESSYTSSCNLVDTFQDGELFLLADDRNPDADQTLRKHRTESITIIADEAKHSKNESSISGEVEIIDVVTPSPCYTRNFGSKKRRLSIVCPEIIDLTVSPIVV